MVSRREMMVRGAGIVGGLALSRVAMPEANINFAHRDPFVGRSWGPAPVHILLTVAGLFVLVYWPTHLVLKRAMPAPRAY